MTTSLRTLLLTALALLLVPQFATAGEDDGPACPSPRPPTFQPLVLKEAVFTAPVFGLEKPGEKEPDGKVDGPTTKIQNGPCSWCNSNSSCSTPCIDDNGNDDVCSSYACDPCREALVEIGREKRGEGMTKSWLYLCRHRVYWDVHWRSVNSPSCQIYTTCEELGGSLGSFYQPFYSTCCNYLDSVTASRCFGINCNGQPAERH